jgi:F-type H+-transporting ATPase subunit b
LEALGINLGYLLVQIVSFLIALVILRGWVYKPVLNMLEKRRKTIAQGLEDARLAAEARANAEKEAERILTEAQQEAAGKLREASERAQEVAREVQMAAEKDVVKLRETASAEATAERDRVLADLRGHIAALAIAAAQKVVGEALDEKRHRALIDGFFSGVEGGTVEVLKDLPRMTGANAEVVSALPLTESEEQTVRKDILEKLGSGASLTFRVDPTILGGLKIRVGDRVVDGSVAGRLESMRRTLH